MLRQTETQVGSVMVQPSVEPFTQSLTAQMPDHPDQPLSWSGGESVQVVQEVPAQLCWGGCSCPGDQKMSELVDTVMSWKKVAASC